MFFNCVLSGAGLDATLPGVVASSGFTEAEDLLLSTGHLIHQLMTQTCRLFSQEDVEDNNPGILEAKP